MTMAEHQHEWVEEYYGGRCKICGLFVPDGQGPWMPAEDVYDDDYWLDDDGYPDEFDLPTEEEEARIAEEEYYYNQLFVPDGQGPWMPAEPDEFDLPTEEEEARIAEEEYYYNHWWCETCGREFGEGWSTCTCDDEEEIPHP